MLIFGEVAEVDEAGSRVRLALPDRDGMVTHWMPVTQASTGQHQVRVMPSVGERMAAVMDAELVRGAVIGAVYSDANSAPIPAGKAVYARFGDGSAIEGDGERNWTWSVPAGGSIRLRVGPNEVLIDDAGITITAVAVNGVQA